MDKGDGRVMGTASRISYGLAMIGMLDLRGLTRRSGRIILIENSDDGLLYQPEDLSSRH